MYDINTKNLRKGIGFYSLFLIVGLFFLFILASSTIYQYNMQNKLDSSVMSTSVKVKSYYDDGTKMYSSIYNFIVNNREYSCKSETSSNIYPESDNTKIYYDSSDPTICMTENYSKIDFIVLIYMFIPTVCIIIAVKNINKIIKRIKMVKELKYKGKLVKNLDYELGFTGMSRNGVEIQKPIVNYTLPNGNTITLYGDPRHDNKLSDDDGKVDLLIDESNPDNYFIDYEINRIENNYIQENNNQSILKQQELDHKLQSDENQNNIESNNQNTNV